VSSPTSKHSRQRHILIVRFRTVLLAQLGSAAPSKYEQHGLVWTTNALRMNHIQVVGTDDSYHVESTLEERPTQEKFLPDFVNTFFSHAALKNQLSDLHIRNFA
jgi:hypothetical protein